MKALISVIIPAYNVEDHIAATLDSVLAQTHKNLQILVVNDGSTDATGSIIDEYARRDSRVTAIHKENGGVTSARLCGLAEAKGKYIGFVDGDDYIEPQMYQRLLANLEAHEADISHCGHQMVFPGGRIDYYYNTGKLTVQKDAQGCADLLKGAFVEPGLWNKLYRWELFAGVTEWLDSSIRINEDLLMNFYLFRQAKLCVYEDFCPYHYMMRRGSATKAKLNGHQLKDPLKVRKILCRETAQMPQWYKLAYRRLMYQLVYSAAMPLGTQKEMIRPFRKEARKELRQRLWDTLKGNDCDTKLKIMVLWTALWPASYHWVHSLYAKVTGLDKKYAID